MSSYGCRNKCVLSFQLKSSSDGAVIMSSGRLCQSFVSADANDRCLMVTNHDKFVRYVSSQLYAVFDLSALSYNSVGLLI